MLDANTVKNQLSTKDIIKLCCSLQGDDTVFYDNQGHPIFNTCLDHENGSSWKLYYYPETGLFHCYTTGDESYDIFELVKRSQQIEFKDAFSYVVQFFNLHDNGENNEDNFELTSDWDIFQRVQDLKDDNSDDTPLATIPENLVEYFYPLAAPTEWQKEGISPKIMRYYGIRIDSALEKVVIPHRNQQGELIGIRGRSFNPIEVTNGKKYMPIIIQGEMYRHSLGKNLFGLYENQHVIHRIKKAFVVESEKSVMQLASMYGYNECWAVATCGSSFSKEQMNLLLDLGVEEIVLGYDREFQGGKGASDTSTYEAKLLKVVSPLLPYVNVSVIMDYDHLTPYKASPTDCGKQIFETLYHNRIKLYTYKEDLKKKRRNI